MAMMYVVATARQWATELLCAGKTAWCLGGSAPLPIPIEQLLKLGLRATSLALFWPLAWIWVAHYAASHILLSLGWEPACPTHHPKVVQLEAALARSRASAAALALERDSAMAAESNHSCQLRLLQDECADKTLQLTKLRQALAAKELELKAYRQALGHDSVEGALAMQAIGGEQDAASMEPNTPEERVRRVSWPSASPRPHAAASPSARAPKSASSKLEHNWDWQDLLGDIDAAAPPPDAVRPQVVTPAFPPPALEVEQSYSEAAPREYLDPISLTLIKDPVVTPAGVTYDRASIAAYISSHHSDPATGAPLQPTMLYPNLALRDLIQKFLVDAPPRSTTTSLSSPATFDTPPRT